MANNPLPELVFVTFPAMGHLLPLIRIAETVITRVSNRVSAVILIVKSPVPDDKVNSYIKSLNKSDNHPFFTFLELPSLDHNVACQAFSRFPGDYIEAYKAIIKQTLHERYGSSSVSAGGRRLSGLILDMFGTSLIDVANDLHVPSFIFFTPNATTLIQAFYMEAIQGDDRRSPEMVPGFKHPYPKKYWHQISLNPIGLKSMINHATHLRRAKGIMVNTYMELEKPIIEAWLSSDERKNPDGHIPSIYPVGPTLTLEDSFVVDKNDQGKNQIISWLDTQPPSSVVFLCFGSEGLFSQEQAKEIAVGLERSGQRFLWSLRLVSPNKSNSGCANLPTANEDDDFSRALPEGFLNRTAAIGKVIGWAPQVKVLAHKAVSAFVSHCGWNSVLESLWFGVPILAWPMYAEQQMNAFLLVKELGLAVEVRLDYMYDTRSGTANMVVGADEVEKAVRRMMEEEEGRKVRQTFKEMSEKARKSLSEAYHGSSYESMGRFLEDLCL